MTQIKAMTHKEPHVVLSDKERKKLDVWPEADGWCSSCARGVGGRRVRVVHIGSKRKAVNIALCLTCLKRMTAATPQAGAAKEDSDG